MTPRIINDGDFTKEHQIGPDEWVFPFVDRGDAISFECKRKYRVDQSHYKPMAKMTKIHTARGDAYLVDEGQPSSIESGLLEYQRTFASVPQYRVEGTSIVYSMQFLSTSANYDFQTPPPQPTVAEFPFTMSAEKRFEYFLTKPEPNYAPRVAIIFGKVFIIGAWGTFKFGEQYLAEDSKVNIYKAGIYVRESIYITWPLKN